MLLFILVAVLGQTVDYNGNHSTDYAYSYPQNTSVLGKNYTEDYNGGYTQDYSYGPENYTTGYSKSYGPENYTTGYSQNVPTAAGVYCNAGFFLEGTSCKPCPAGFTSFEEMNVCVACAAGKTTTTAGSPYCYNCPSGKSSFPGVATCFDCPAGKSADGGSPMCTVCSAGKFSVAGAFMCEPCWAGSYSEAGATTCQDCPQGTTSMQGSPSLSMCSTMTATAKLPPSDEYVLVDDEAKGPLENAMELHNEAVNAQSRAEEAQRIAEAEEAEAKEAYEQKMEAEKELHFAEEKYEEVHNEKLVAEEAKYNAVIRYEDEAKEAENADAEAMAAKEESERAALRAFEASHAVKMQSEGEANQAVVNAKLEQEEHFHAELEYKEKLFEAEQESIEAEQANQEAQKAAIFAEQQNQQAEIARAEVMVASSHRDIQKAEAMQAQHEADMALREHEVAEAHHENVIASKERNEDVWDNMLEDDCVDDPMGLVVNDPSKNCDDVGSETHWSCGHFDEDFNGHPTFIWEICPRSCNMCGTDRDQYYEEHHHKEDEHDHLPECLSDCPFEGLDFEDPVTACPWWHAEGPEHNTDSCFNDCSPGVMFYVEHHVQKVCHGGPDDNPLECAMDCPIENLDPHSAESFCPWFSGEKDNDCFHDCSDKFLNMAQAHAEHTCYEYEIEGDKYINYISEPIVGADGEYSQSSIICEGGYYRSSMTEGKCTVCPAGMFSYPGAYECLACPSDLTSFPGAASPEDCFVRASLKTEESYDMPSHDFEDKNQYEDNYQSEDKNHTEQTYPSPSNYDEYENEESAHTSYNKEWETKATVEPINYDNTPYTTAEYYNEDMPRTSVDPMELTYNNEQEDMPRAAVDPTTLTYNNEVYTTEPEYYPTETSYPARAGVETYDTTGQATDYYTTQPEFVNEEYVNEQPQFGELSAPEGSEYSPSTYEENEAELLSGAGNH